MGNRKRGQSTLEYIIVLTAIVAAVILGAVVITGQKTSSPNTGLGKLMKQAGSSIERASDRAKGVIPTP